MIVILVQILGMCMIIKDLDFTGFFLGVRCTGFGCGVLHTKACLATCEHNSGHDSDHRRSYFLLEGSWGLSKQVNNPP